MAATGRHGSAHGRTIERHFAAQEKIRVEIAEHQIGIRDGRLGTAASVTGRPRFRAGAVRPDLQQPKAVDARNRSAAGADLEQIEDRDRDRNSAAGFEALHPIDFERAGPRRFAVLDEAQLCRRPTHVEGQEVPEVRQLAEEGRGLDTRRRARLDHLNRKVLGGSGGRAAAVGLHDEQLMAIAARFQRPPRAVRDNAQPTA
ncbi:MAG: hypothetical protein WDO24_21665 [Pseudomonadota bacterium]